MECFDCNASAMMKGNEREKESQKLQNVPTEKSKTLDHSIRRPEC